MPRTGFTLLEVIVVLAVMGIVATTALLHARPVAVSTPVSVEDAIRRQAVLGGFPVRLDSAYARRALLALPDGRLLTAEHDFGLAQ